MSLFSVRHGAASFAELFSFKASQPPWKEDGMLPHPRPIFPMRKLILEKTKAFAQDLMAK